jgi:hypothetical protein
MVILVRRALVQQIPYGRKIESALNSIKNGHSRILISHLHTLPPLRAVRIFVPLPFYLIRTGYADQS